jgi:hypothetical protein
MEIKKRKYGAPYSLIKKHPGGRPPKYNTPEEMQIAIDKYFENCPDMHDFVNAFGQIKKVPSPTISGLALYLGFSDRWCMWDYEKYPEFSNTIKLAKAKITSYYETAMRAGQCAGSIFMLKNLGYSDVQKILVGGDKDSPAIQINEIKSLPDLDIAHKIMERVGINTVVVSQGVGGGNKN